MTLVVDASLLVATLVDSGPVGTWAEEQLAGSDYLAAPHVMPVEVANILRRAVLAGEVSEDASHLAHEDLLALRVQLYPYAAFARRVWQVRPNVTAYDAW